MKYLNHFFYQFFLILLLIKKFPFKLLLKKYKKDSINVVWLFPQFPFGFFRYFGSAAVFQDAALINSLINELDDIRFFIGPKIGKIRNVNFLFFHR